MVMEELVFYNILFGNIRYKHIYVMYYGNGGNLYSIIYFLVILDINIYMSCIMLMEELILYNILFGNIIY